MMTSRNACSGAPPGNVVPNTTTRWRSRTGIAASRLAASTTRFGIVMTSGEPATMPEIRAMLASRSVVGAVSRPDGVDSEIWVPSPAVRTNSTDAP